MPGNTIESSRRGPGIQLPQTGYYLGIGIQEIERAIEDGEYVGGPNFQSPVHPPDPDHLPPAQQEGRPPNANPLIPTR